MADVKMSSAGVTATEIDLSGPRSVEPVGIPAGVIGTALKGPAFVPVTHGSIDDYFALFGTSDGKKFGPIAVSTWMKNAGAVTYMRVLGVGDGEKKSTSDGTVANAGFVVGAQQAIAGGALSHNPYAVNNGPLGRTYMLGCYMSETLGSTYFSDAGIQSTGSPVASAASSVLAAVPIVRGIVMAASGVVLRLSSSLGASAAPSSTTPATGNGGQGTAVGIVKLLEAGITKQEFVMLLNGHKGTDAAYPNVITASFDPTAQNYFGNVFNKDPLKYQNAGHYLYAYYDINPAVAVVTGTVWLSGSQGAGAAAGALAHLAGQEHSAFITTSSYGAGRNAGLTTVPNYENFQSRFSAPKTPYVISQKFGGTAKNLFRIDSLDDGDYAAKKIKISIENIAATTDTKYRYGTFDLMVRKIDDTDDDPVTLEEFRGLSLDPAADRYIAKVIGDQHVYYDFEKSSASQKLVMEGSYPNKSAWIRVTMNSEVDSAEVDPTALPFGHRGSMHLVTSGSATLHDTTSAAGGPNTILNVLRHAVQPPVPMRKVITNGPAAKLQASSNYYWGAKFQTTVDVAELNKGKLYDRTIENLTKFLPDFKTDTLNVGLWANEGTADTAANGVLDADRFNNNIFTLENIQVVTGSDTKADTKTVDQWTYVRKGAIAANEPNKTRAMSNEDLKKSSVRTYAKFTMFMQGGFNGINVFNADEAALTDNAVLEEMDNAGTRLANNGPIVKSYMKAVDIMKNTADVDIQLLAIPGIRQAVITDYATQACNDRFDAMLIMDVLEKDELDSAVTSSADQTVHVGNTVTTHVDRNLDSNFSAAYFPDVIMPDPTIGTSVRVPPSVAVLGAYALNDAIGHPWFAPAGYSRGSLGAASEAAVKLSKDNLDLLYEADINPIVAFANSNGPVIWGQKTLQKAQTALDRVNVRRLLIELRREVRDVANTMIFEPNREATLSKFSAGVRPRIEAIQAKRGVTRFKIAIDTTTTSTADIENNTIRGKIWIQPTKVAEFISLDFLVTNQGE